MRSGKSLGLEAVGWRTIAGHGLALALAALALQWLEYRWLARSVSTELAVLLIALGFTGLGGWVASRLLPRAAAAGFERNEAAIRALGLSPREVEVLERLADGGSNKEIARALSVSPNTIKTHVARLYEKLAVARRTQAIARARELSLIP